MVSCDYTVHGVILVLISDRVYMFKVSNPHPYARYSTILV